MYLVTGGPAFGAESVRVFDNLYSGTSENLEYVEEDYDTVS